jgi:hypothetical protein
LAAPRGEFGSISSWSGSHDAALELMGAKMTLNHTFSLMTFALLALCFVAFVASIKPQPLYHSETAVGAFSARNS